MIPYGKQEITEDDIEAVIKILRSEYLTQGPVVPLFEKVVSSYCGAQNAIAVNSATSALHIACRALGVGKDDIVWTSPITFVASANCALYCGAKVDFVDIDPRTYNLCHVELEKKLERAAQQNTLPKVVIPVHMCGQPCNMEKIGQLGKKYGFKIIEDASHAIGGKYKGEKIGNCRYSDITVFSFHPVKIITTGEGGMALTNDSDLKRKMELLRSHGITREQNEMTEKTDGPWYYQQIHLGYNYRMTEIQAALGISQMRRLDEYVARRHELAIDYDRQFQDLRVTPPWQHPDGYSARHLYVVLLQLESIHTSHLTVFQYLQEQGVGVNLHYIPVHIQPYFRNLGFMEGQFPLAEDYYTRALSLPMYPTLHKSQQDHVVSTLKKALEL